MGELRGFKVFNHDWTCRGYQFEVGKTFEENVKPECCESGFHFCLKAADCFKYYNFDPNNKVAEVIALGEVDTENYDSKCATNKIQIVREITWQEVLDLVNTGKACTGLYNSGNRNSGDCNSGDCNSGNRNSGCFNTQSQKLRFFDEEKASHPEHETTGGYLKNFDNTDYYTEWWNGLSDKEKNIIRNIPNYDAKKFFMITGIKDNND